MESLQTLPNALVRTGFCRTAPRTETVIGAARDRRIPLKIRISVCEKVIQYASTYYNRQTINENHGYKSHNAKTLKSHFTKCTMPNCAIKPDKKIGRFSD